MSTVIKNVSIVNEGKTFVGDVLIENDRIAKISSSPIDGGNHEIDGTGLHQIGRAHV